MAEAAVGQHHLKSKSWLAIQKVNTQVPVNKFFGRDAALSLLPAWRRIHLGHNHGIDSLHGLVWSSDTTTWRAWSSDTTTWRAWSSSPQHEVKQTQAADGRSQMNQKPEANWKALMLVTNVAGPAPLVYNTKRWLT